MAPEDSRHLSPFEARHYDLESALDFPTRSLEVTATILLAARRSGVPAGPEPAAGGVRFLLHSDLKVLSPPVTLAPDAAASRSCDVERVARLDPGQSELGLHYRGRSAQAWTSPQTVELSATSLWYPIFPDQVTPFTFRLRLTVPPEVLPAVSGRLIPRPHRPETRLHDDDGPRTYSWESIRPSDDIAVCVGPYLVHQRQVVAAGAPSAGVTCEVFVLNEDYDLGEPVLDWLESVLGCQTRPAEQGAVSGRAERLGVVVSPVSGRGVYCQPGQVVLPRQALAAMRGPGGRRPAVSTSGSLAQAVVRAWTGQDTTPDDPWGARAPSAPAEDGDGTGRTPTAGGQTKEGGR